MSKKMQNLRGESKETLQKELTELREKSRVALFNREGSRSKNVKEAGATKKRIARILTLLNNS